MTIRVAIRLPPDGDVALGPEVRAAIDALPPAGLSILRGALATRDAGPRVLLFLGDSITAGLNATAPQWAWVNQLIAALQKRYPLATGTAQQSSDTYTNVYANRASLVAGIYGANGGTPGVTAADYVSAGWTAAAGELNVRTVVHAIGTNDYGAQVPVATYKANVQTQVNAFKAAITVPCLQVLVHYGDRMDLSTQTIPWSAYGAALAEIADADTDGEVIYIDLSGPLALNGVPGTDPLNLLDGDNLHPTNSGHSLIADLLFEQLTAPPPRMAAAVVTGGGGTTPALTNTSLPTITGTATQGQTLTAGNGSWSATPDSFTYQWKRGGTNISGATASTYLLAAGDVGSTVTVTVTAVKSGYTSGSANSAATGTVAAFASGSPTVTDTFTRANNATVPGTTETGSLTWGMVNGTAGIASNTLRVTASSDAGDCTVNTGSANGTLSMKAVTNPELSGLAFRIAANHETGYVFWRNGAGYALALRTAAAAYTSLGSSTGVTAAAGDVLSVVMSGSSITCKVNGATVISVTDSAATGTRHGVWVYTSAGAVDYDDFAWT